MKPIFLTGYMGSGKSTLGVAVAKATGMRFIDLDDYITEHHGASIPEIFATHGEMGFREIERDMLHEVCGLSDTIIACGGGTPCFFDNMEVMNALGLTILLSASEGRLLSRLTEDRDKRPLLAGKTDSEIRTLIVEQQKAREPFYSKAAHRWNSDNLEDREQIAASVAAFIDRFHLPCLNPEGNTPES